MSEHPVCSVRDCPGYGTPHPPLLREAPERRSWVLTVRTRPRSLNAERSAHWTLHRAQTTAEKMAWMAEAKNAHVPPLHAVEITAQPNYADHPQDTGNCYPSVKAAIDGLVLAGVIPDDTGQYVLSIKMLAPGSTPVDALTLLIEETTP